MMKAIFVSKFRFLLKICAEVPSFSGHESRIF